MQVSASSGVSTVPAPMSARPRKRSASSRITSTAPGTVMVISNTEMPPASTASAARSASSAEGARTTGTTPISSM